MLNRLSQVLLECATDQMTGIIKVGGEPGGTVYLANGGVAAIDTPGAPGPEVLLLRSGRVPESGWIAALGASADSGALGAELVQRDLIGAGELEVLLRMALADAMFVLAAGELADYEVEKEVPDCALPLDPAAEPAWLLAETSRRLGVLASLSSPVEHDRDRWTAARGAGPAGGVPSSGFGGGTDAILALANGRRTARDIAFVLGRGVYAVTLQMARMYADGLLVPGSRRAVPVQPGDPVRRPAGQDQAGRDRAGGSAGTSSATDGTAAAGTAAGADAAVSPDKEKAPALPRRRRSSPGQSRRSRSSAGQVDRAALLRLLRPGGPGTDGDQGDTV